MMKCKARKTVCALLALLTAVSAAACSAPAGDASSPQANSSEGSAASDASGGDTSSEKVTFPLAEPIMMRTLCREGYRIAMVADGYAESFRNIYRQHQMDDCFEQRIYSSDVGEEKPDRRMFLCAMNAMGLHEEDKSRIIMVGNNIKRDVAGANRFGITSVLLDWTPRYPMQPEQEDERPDYVIHMPMELVALVHRLEKGREKA